MSNLDDIKDAIRSLDPSEYTYQDLSDICQLLLEKADEKPPGT